MTLDTNKLNAAAEEAKAKTTNRRWINAINAAVKGLTSGKWIVTELANCLVITTETSEKTYRVTEKICQCESFFHDQPCRHRAAVRLLQMMETGADEAVSRPAPSITRSIERDHRGNRCAVVRCDGWMI